MKIREITEGAFTNALLKTKELTANLAGHSWKSPHDTDSMKPVRQVNPVQTSVKTPAAARTAAPTNAPGATNANLTPAQQRWAAANKAGAQAGSNLQLAPLPAEKKPELAPGVEIVQADTAPITLSYKGTLFHIDDNDKWHRSSNDKLVSPGMQAFLTKQLQAL